jgi:predicted TIM-barrel fold metal-dependent hydrolase
MGDNDTYNRAYTDLIYHEIEKFPLIDTHMHIQSNDIAPLPIMYGVLCYQVNKALHEIVPFNKHLEDKINFENFRYDDRGTSADASPPRDKKPTFSDFANHPNLLGSLENFKKELPLGAALTVEIIAALFFAKYPWLLAGLRIGGYAFLHGTELGQDIMDFLGNRDNQRKALTNLTAQMTLLINEYGKIARQDTYLIASIYKDSFFQSTLGFRSRARYAIITYGDEKEINYNSEDVGQSNAERETIISRSRQNKDFLQVTRHYYGNRGFNIQPSFSFSIIHSMELMYAHYWGAYGIPVYIPYRGKLYYVCNSFIYRKSRSYETGEKVYNAYDIQRNTIRNSFEWSDDETGESSLSAKEANVEAIGKTGILNSGMLGGTERYSHFLKQVSAQEVCQFEDFNWHLKNVKAATVKYPLEFLPFYHFDARRFYAPLTQGYFRYLHDFYTFVQNGPDSTRYLNRIKRLDSTAIFNSISQGDTFKYKMNFRDIESNLLINNGLFWGIKMYTAMGYPPNIYDSQTARKIFPKLDSNAYQGLKDFYRFCVDNKVPITCHGSPQGMTLADPEIYLKEHLKAKSNSRYSQSREVNFPANSQGFISGLGLVDTFSDPYGWEEVLKETPALTLCLAHFGGMRFFSGKYPGRHDNDTPYRWLDKICDVIKRHDNVYTDISCFSFENFEPYPIIISTSLYEELKGKIEPGLIEKMYTLIDNTVILDTRFIDRASLSSSTVAHMAELRLEIIKAIGQSNPEHVYAHLVRTAGQLADLIKNDRSNKLRERILFGTDWPLSEMGITGIASYNSAMFILAQLLTEKLNNTWDAWRQFAVINPLRFLGFIDEEDSDSEKYEFKFAKLDKMKAAIEDFVNKIDIRQDAKYKNTYNIVVSDVLNILNARYEAIKQSCGPPYGIRKADKMRTGNGTIMVLTNKQIGG